MSVRSKNLAVPLMLILAFVASADAYKILLVFPLPTPSHAILGQGYAKELLKKGHEVTFITLFPKNNQNKNLTLIDVSHALKVLSTVTKDMPKMFEGRDHGDENQIGVQLMNALAQSILQHESLQSLMHDHKQLFDLVVVEWYYNEILAGLSAIFQCPLVWSNSLNLHSGISRLVDDFMNPSYTSNFFGSDIPPFTFYQRVNNLRLLLQNYYESRTVHAENAIQYEIIYGPAASKRGVTLPPYEDLIYNASMCLINSHASLDAPINLPQNVKAIGGYHIEVPHKPLPQDLQNIMDASHNGVIYFSMGSFMKASLIPSEIKKSLLNLFGGLNQTVLWKFEEELPNRPSNVHVRNWLPQPSILAHPNIKLFITHGGLLSTTETIHYGVPIIGIPIFGDQFLNVERAAKKGLGVSVKISHDIVTNLEPAIKEVLTNSSYAATAKRLSSLYHDRPLLPGEELVYWIEYVVRTGGAPHLRSAALLLPWYQRLYLDLLAIIVAALLGIILTIKYILSSFKNKQNYTKQKIN